MDCFHFSSLVPVSNPRHSPTYALCLQLFKSTLPNYYHAEAFKNIKLLNEERQTKICQSLRSMKRVRICEDPMMGAWYTTNGQNLIGNNFCCDVLFIRPVYESMFQTIRQNEHVILIGNPDMSKSV